MKYLSFLIINLLVYTGFAQHQCNIWYTGTSYQYPFPGGITQWNFTEDSLHFSYHNDYPISFFECHASISNKNGELVFYTNGLVIMNAAQDTMQNGTGLNPGTLANTYPEYGYPIVQGAIIIPNPSNNGIYYLFHTPGVSTPNVGYYTDKLLYSVIDMNLENGLGAVTAKNQVAIQGFQQGYMAAGQLVATRHANGRDWWVVIPRVTMNGFYKVLVTPNGIENNTLQNIGTYTPTYSNGQACFSPDGNHYIRFYPGTIPTDSLVPLFIYDFDRCTGLLSNEKMIQIPMLPGGISVGGCAVSPNNRYLYISAWKQVYQFDLQATDIEGSRALIDEYDGFVEFFPVYFNAMQLAINGKIYMNASNGTSYFHVIDYPDSQGVACHFRQHGLQLPSKNSFTIPNFPNYALGALSGSTCDTLVSYQSAVSSYQNVYAYPNPTKDKIFVGGNHLGNAAVLSLCNSMGQEVYHHTWENTQIETAISMACLPQGVYYLRILAGDKVFTEKIVRE